MIQWKCWGRIILLNLLIACTIALACKTFSTYIENKATENQDKLKSGYTWYYNGEKVDSDKMDLYLYDYTVNDEKKSVYLTNKQPVKYKSETELFPYYWGY